LIDKQQIEYGGIFLCAVMVDEWSAGRAGTVSFLLFLQSEEVNELPGKLWFVGL
jgi:hypothetical protein